MLFFVCALSLGLAGVSASTGVNIHFTGAPAADLDAIGDAGFGWVRMDFSWSGVEREKGVYRFEPYDKLVEGLSARGIGALFILDYSNRLYEKDRSVRTAEGRAAFARFAAAAAARYRDRKVRWEVWNEPNLKQFWSPQPSVGDYMSLVAEASRAIREADPQARILAPACSGFPWEFLERLLQGGLCEYVDAVSVHPYRSSPPETVREDYARLRRLIVRYTPAGKMPPPVVSGEWGYSTWHHGGKPFSAEVQGQYLAREFLTNIAEGIPLSIWYDWCNDGPDPRETEHNFGTVTLDRKPKPAYLAARTLTRILGKARFERRLEVAGRDHFLLFEKDGRRILAAWTAGAPHDATLTSGGVRGRLPATGFTGERSEVVAAAGRLELPLSGGPLYVELPAGSPLPAVCGLDAAPHARGLRVQVARSGPGDVRARIEVNAGGRTISRKVTLSDGARRVVDVPLDWPAGRGVRTDVRLVEEATGAPLAALEPSVYTRIDLNRKPPEVVLDGDPAVKGDAVLSVTDLDGDGARLGSRALEVRYEFAPGWKFLRVVGPKGLPVGPAVFSVWVRGDGSGTVLRCRFRDSRGETFQPTAGEIRWKGWRRVEMRLAAQGAGSWGGDKKVDYPISWDSILLLDSTRRGGKGRVAFTGLFLVSPAKK